MNSKLKPATRFCAKLMLFVALSLVQAFAADAGVQVHLDVKNASPRAVESLTERGILRDYRFAWTSMAQAFELNTQDPLEGPFTGQAKASLMQAVAAQQGANLTQQYTNQVHRLEAVFYASEGDVMELHDTAEFDLRISDAGKVIHDEHVVRHFIVLMTPGADRWAIRQLQAVPQF